MCTEQNHPPEPSSRLLSSDVRAVYSRALLHQANARITYPNWRRVLRKRCGKRSSWQTSPDGVAEEKYNAAAGNRVVGRLVVVVNGASCAAEREKLVSEPRRTIYAKCNDGRQKTIDSVVFYSSGSAGRTAERRLVVNKRCPPEECAITHSSPPLERGAWPRPRYTHGCRVIARVRRDEATWYRRHHVVLRKNVHILISKL